MQNKAFWSMFGINIIIILIFSLFLLKDKKNDNFVAPGITNNLEQQIIDGATKSTEIVVQIIAESKVSYYQEGSFDKDFLLEKSSLLKKGSGIIASKKGYIITNNHVVDDINLKYSVITNNGEIFPVKKIRKDDIIDVAILSVNFENKINSEARFIDIDNIVNLGQFVFAIGNPLSEYPNTVSLGIISGKGRNLLTVPSNNTYYAGLYQTDAALNPGNSGGPLIDLSGEVVGMITAISLGGNNIGFALPLNNSFIQTTIDILEQNNSLIRPYLGVFYIDNSSGAIVDTIFVDSPAQNKLLSGDVILAIDKRNISLSTPLLYYLYSYQPNDTVILSVMRNGQIISIPIVLGQKTL